MIAYLSRRAAILAATLLVASFVIFALVNVLPGDPARYMMGLEADPQAVAALRAELGLDQPFVARYLKWIAGLLSGDLGVSYTYRTPVIDLIAERLSVSGPLAVLSLALAVGVGVPLGVWAAARRGTLVDAAIMAGSQAGVAIPNFWFALLLMLVFAVGLGWAPAGGFPGWQAGLGPALAALILPAIALALPQAAILARVMRSSLIETLSEDYIRTARAKGLSETEALLAHALRNAAIPVLTILGLQFSFLLAGAVIIENVFYLPGLGRLAFQAILQRDLIVVQGVVLVLCAAVVLIAFLVDALYVAIDPRLRRPMAGAQA
jgi:ABC-type dipeptide/oligopeptide/nickel transport system permease component